MNGHKGPNTMNCTRYHVPCTLAYNILKNSINRIRLLYLLLYTHVTNQTRMEERIYGVKNPQILRNSQNRTPSVCPVTG